MKRILGIIAALAGAVTLLAQVRETVNVNVVEVPVTVVDSSGNPVRGLTAVNFELYDNGQKRDITGFDAIDFASTQSVGATSPQNPNARRQFMLLFDLGYASPNGMSRAQEAARKFVSESVQPRDLVAVSTIEPDRGFRLITAFTTDRALVASAIADPRAYRGSDPLQIANNTEAFKPIEESSSGKGNSGAAAEEQIETANRMQKMNDAAVRQRVDREVDALGALAKMLRAVPGRKQVVLLSEGFDPKYLQGRDARATQEGYGENEQVIRGQSYNVDNDERYGNATSQKGLDEMARYFRQSDVILHSIDIQGIRVQNDVASGAKLNSNAGLFLLSRPTGGQVFENANDMKANLDKMLHQQEVVYVLSFQAPTQKPGTFHNLKVKLVNVPGGARASNRAGYYEGGGETAQERTLSNAEIIVNDVPQNDLHLHALTAAFPTSGNNLQVPVIVEANGNDLMKDSRGATKVEIYIYAFDSDGIVRDRLYQAFNLDLRKVGDKLKTAGLKYYGTLSLPPGKYAIKSLVRAVETDRRGFARTDIVIPKPGDVAGFSIVPMEEQAKWVMVKGESHAANAAYPFVLNGNQFFPTAVAKDKVAVYVYGARTQDLDWKTNPKTKFLGRADGASDGAAALVLQLDPGDAKAAALDIKVWKKGTNDAKTVTVPISE